MSIETLFRIEEDKIFISAAASSESINEILRTNSYNSVEFIDKIDNVGEIDIVMDLEGLDNSDDDHLSNLDNDTNSPIIKAVDDIIKKAYSLRASDIHIEPYEKLVLVRYRVDGSLIDGAKLPFASIKPLIARIKIISGLNITEKRKPQDGRSFINVGGHKLDLRISFIPGQHGERCVMRILDSKGLDNIIKNSSKSQRYNKILKMGRRKNGFLIVCGPTGSGKSTTMYGIIEKIKSSKINILTIEDPIEYEIPGISQTQVDEANGMGFSDGLRSILRQDPDVILVGEIRDAETARMSVQSSLTGHMVFSTLHTNSAIGTITRLVNLGIDKTLIESSLTGVISQRLIKKLCKCAKSSNTIIDLYNRKIKEKNKAEGCENCNHTGYLGRVAVYGIIENDKLFKQFLHGKIDKSEVDDGLIDDCIDLVEEGVCDILELEALYLSK